MPRGSILGITANRNAGDGSSIFVDLKKGELTRADFNEASCSNGVIEQIKARRAQGEVRATENEKAIGQKPLTFQNKPLSPPGQPPQPIETTDSANQPPVRTRQ